MTLPLSVLALLWDRFDVGRCPWLRGREIRLGRLTLHTTTLASGTMFLVLGSLFLLFDGTSAIPSPMGVDTEYVIEEQISDVGAVVSDPVFLLTVAALAAVTAAVALFRSTRQRHRAEAPPPPGDPTKDHSLPHEHASRADSELRPEDGPAD